MQLLPSETTLESLRGITITPDLPVFVVDLFNTTYTHTNISEEAPSSTIFLGVSEEITYCARVITELNAEFPSSMQEIIFQQNVVPPYTTLVIFHPSFFKHLALSKNVMQRVVDEAIKSINKFKN